MRRTKKGQCWSTGERGRNRVRVFPDPTTGIYQMEWRRNGRREARSLKHRDLEKAKVQAEQLAANFPEPDEQHEPEPLTLGKLFEMYLKEVTPTKGSRAQKHDEAVAPMFRTYFGADRVVASLSLRDWERFIRDRRAGRIGPGEGPWKAVADRTIERDLRFILAVFNWATMAGDGNGGALLERNPFRGYKPPKEKNPLRVIVTGEEYKALLRVSMEVDWRFHVALVVAHETGHRIGAIRRLRWSDVDLEGELLTWRAENEKTGYEHVTPLTKEARAALGIARTHNPGIGDTPVLPALKDPTRPVGRYLMRDWWHEAETRGQLERKKGRGWHSLRRKFASDLIDKPLKVLCDLGGWKRPETVIECYQKVSQARMREALADRRRA